MTAKASCTSAVLSETAKVIETVLSDRLDLEGKAKRLMGRAI